MKLFYAFLLICGTAINAFAQKLPDVQSSSVLAPSSVKIDGRNLEWNNFSADNKRNGLLYTIANDDKNLYLAIKVADNDAITKVLAGGIAFSIHTKGKKREEEANTITFPLIVRGNVNRGGIGPGSGASNRQRMGLNRPEQSQEQRDSATFAQRKTQLAAIKEIKIKGFNIADSIISIYNEYGIKAVAKIDEQNAYFCEIAIPLASLALTVDDKREVAYQIKLNGRQAGNFVRANAGPGGFGGGGNNRGGFGGGNNSAQQELMMPTDFWGKYIIQK